MATIERKSPYASVSDRMWALAYDEAVARIYAHENGSEREPTEAEIDHALELLMEQRNEEGTNQGGKYE